MWSFPQKLGVYERRTYYFHHHQCHHHWSAIYSVRSTILLSRMNTVEQNKKSGNDDYLGWNPLLLQEFYLLLSTCLGRRTHTPASVWRRERVVHRLDSNMSIAYAPSVPCVFAPTILKWKLLRIQKTPEFFALTWIEKNLLFHKISTDLLGDIKPQVTCFLKNYNSILKVMERSRAEQYL